MKGQSQKQSITFFDPIYMESLPKESAYFIGTDEVGRGPLAGPVVAGAAALIGDFKEPHLLEPFWKALSHLGVTDSKKLKTKKRQEILREYKKIAIETLPPSLSLRLEIACVDEAQIDEINILKASLLAMRKACDALKLPLNSQGLLLIDGNKKINWNEKEHLEIPLVKGDSKSLLIGLASIAAKEYRDDLMTKFSHLYPGYSFEQHAGYPTPKHLEAIKNLGPSPIHRLTFKGVKEHVSRNS